MLPRRLISKCPINLLPLSVLSSVNGASEDFQKCSGLLRAYRSSSSSSTTADHHDETRLSLLKQIQAAFVRGDKGAAVWETSEEKVLELLKSRILSLQDISVILYTLQNASIPTKAAAEHAMKIVTEEIRTIDSQSLAVVLRSLVSIGQPGNAFYSTALRELQIRMTQSLMNTVSVANFAWSYNQLLKSGMVPKDAEYIHTLKSIALSNIESFTTPQLLEIMEVFGRFGIRGDSEINKLLNKAAARMVNNKEVLKETSFTDLIGFANTQAKCRAVNEEYFLLLSSIWKERKALGKLNRQQLCDLVYSYSRMESVNSIVMDELSVECRKKGKQFTFHQLCSILASLTTSSYHSPVLLKMFASKIKAIQDVATVSTLSGIEVVNLAAAFGKFSYSDAKLFEIFSKLLFSPAANEEIKDGDVTFYTAVRLQTLSSRDCIEALRAWAAVHIMDIKLFESATSILKERMEAETLGISNKLLLMYMHACGKVGFRSNDFQMKIIQSIQDEEFQGLETMELLKLSVAVERLALPFPALAEKLNQLLPNRQLTLEMDEPWKRIRRSYVYKRKKINLRKRKWTW